MHKYYFSARGEIMLSPFNDNNKNHGYINADYLTPATYDSKSSPLALLAQTCSAVGSDAPNPKHLAKLEKSQEKSSRQGKSSPTSSVSPNKTKLDFKAHEYSLKGASRNKPQADENERSESVQSVSSLKTQKSSQETTPKISYDEILNPIASIQAESQLKIDTQRDNSYSTMPYYNGYAFPMDLLEHQSMLKSAAMNPYLYYARMKAASSANDMTKGICRDPYCTGCSFSSQFLEKNGAHCPPGFSCHYAACKAQSSPPASVFAYHAQLAQLAAVSQLPYACNWVSADSSYCGKRFAVSEELFQHLRLEHTGNAIPDSMLNAPSAATNSLLAVFPRSYPTPPLSPLSSARHHPYNKNLLLQMTPSIANYFLPYANLYPRM